MNDFEHLVQGGIWNVAPVADEPMTRLSHWRIFLVDGKDVHFAGYAGHEGRVCSAIQSFDPVTGRGVTRSGRIYELVGESGFNGDAMYVWQRWLDMYNNPPHEDITDIYLGK